ncbi:MAG: peptide synthetase [Ruminococcus sp.]|nr:peptide synthetase [Ruminococcus sp.]
MKVFNVNGSVLQCYPLTAAQRIHNYTIKFCPHQVLNIGTGFYVQNEFDVDLLKKSIKLAYQQFESMRIRFLKDDDDTVYQYIIPVDDREIPVFDFSDWNEGDAHNEMKKWTAKPFERYNSPMNYIAIIKLPDGFNGIYLKVDHMTMDSSSLIMFDEYVLKMYCALCYGTEEPKPMMSYLKALEKDLGYEAGSAAYKKDEEFWMNEITSSEPMYTDFNGVGRIIAQRKENNNPDQRCAMVVSRDSSAAIAVYHLEKEPSERLMQFCLDNQVPMASLLLMGLRTILSKFNDNEKDVSVKSCVARRGTLLEKKSGGTRIHFFPIRTKIEPEQTFLEGIRVIQGEQNKLFRHANFDPIDYTIRRAKHWENPPGSSYESLCLTYQPMTLQRNDYEMPDIKYKSIWYTNGVAGQPLYLTVMHRAEDNGLDFNFEYRKDAVTESEMEYLYYYICRALFRGIEDHDRTVGEILDMI